MENNYSALKDEFIHLNGIQEPSWTFSKKFVLLPIMILAIVESLIWTSFFWTVTRLLPKKHLWRIDRRLWPTSFLFFMAGTGCRYVKRHSMTWQALEYLYVWDKSTKELKGLDRMISNIWNQLENVRATRNRLKNVKGQIFMEIERLLLLGKKRITICSLAAGSARGPIEVVALYINKFPELRKKFQLVLVDFDEGSFDFSQKLADELCPGMSSIIITHKALISQADDELNSLIDFVSQYDPDIFEMVGFTDYMPPKKAVKIFSAIYGAMRDGTLFITNNVGPNFEKLFLEVVVSWKMLNRTEKEVESFFKNAGFKNILVIWEATGLQTLYSARK